MVKVLSGLLSLCFLYGIKSGPRDETIPLGSLTHYGFLHVNVLCGGGSLGGEVCDLLVPRSLIASLQGCGAAHGPRHPAVFFSKLCCLGFVPCLPQQIERGLNGLLLCDDLLVNLAFQVFGPCLLLCFWFLRGSKGGNASSQRFVLVRTTGVGGLTDDRR